MKSIYILFTLFTGLLFSSCEKEERSGNFEFGVEKSCEINIEYQSIDNSVKFKLTEINDSRCPSDVVCIWQGMVTVKIVVEKPVSETIELNSYNNTTDTLANYSLELMDVLPYPVSTQTTEMDEYDVKLQVKILDD
ncbi:MAG: hypothetical protein JXR61_03055 [Prolixibacteraceae bacterium]|nr:hypothetical protein [Prolixibacteraceae bacterium]